MTKWIVEIDEELVRADARWCFERWFTTTHILAHLAKVYTPLGQIVKEVGDEFYGEADKPQKEKANAKRK